MIKSLENYIQLANQQVSSKKSKQLLIKQIYNFYEIKEKHKNRKHKYKCGDLVKLKKGTLLHGTWKNITGLKHIAKFGLISGQFEGGREGKYPYTVGVWNLQKDFLLKDYINRYSGGTIRCFFWGKNGKPGKQKDKIIPFNEMNDLLTTLKAEGANIWNIEQTKEARFLPSLAQDFVQIGIIMNGSNSYAKLIKQGDILSNDIPEKDLQEFVHPNIYEDFCKNRKNKDLFFTNRESAIIFGIPNELIEGILVGRIYEKDQKTLNKIKTLFPKAYICNLDGVVINE